MRHRVTSAILLLYPRRVRKGHGPEIVALVDDLIAYERRSPTRLFLRLAVDGLVQRIASTATVWTVVAVLAATSFGGLAVSDLAAAHAPQHAPHSVHTRAPKQRAHTCTGGDVLSGRRRAGAENTPRLVLRYSRRGVSARPYVSSDTKRALGAVGSIVTGIRI
jgi:hypothetical protein